MGPIQLFGNGTGESRKRAIKWVDNDEEQKQGPKLVTNKSDDDLNLKENPEKIQNHYKNSVLKKSIKPFVIDINELTGLSNFKDISKNPLQIPEHGKPDMQGSKVKPSSPKATEQSIQ